MEQIKKNWRDMPLQRFFVVITAITLLAVVLLSGAVIWGCAALRDYLLPEPNAIWLTIEHTYSNGSTSSKSQKFSYGLDGQISRWGNETTDITSGETISTEFVAIESPEEITISETFEAFPDTMLVSSSYTIQKIVSNVDTLTPKRKLLYHACGVVMVIVPLLLSFGGVLLCCSCFYRYKLRAPLRLLSNATKQIMEKNLDFTIFYDCQDELGLLCQSFEQMRFSLCQNNKAMWEMLEERRQLQASVAHDLRNPIAIIQGYTEYLQIHLADGLLNQEQIYPILCNLDLAAARLGHYTESLRELSQLEDLELEKKPIAANVLAESLASDAQAMVFAREGLRLRVQGDLPSTIVQADAPAICRILENVVDNALRFAVGEMTLDLALCGNTLSISVRDDGPGFSRQVLEEQHRPPRPKARSDGHMGMGLTVSRLLCQKHGGSLTLSNGVKGGAVVKLVLEV